MANSTTFIKVSNKEVYSKLNSIDEKLVSIESKLDITNGKIKLTRWMATTALSLIVIIIGFMVKGG